MRVSSPSALIRTSEIQEALFRFSRGVASCMRYKLVAHRVGERVPQGTGHTGEFAEKLISLEEMRVSLDI